jgi:hypothetical protein
MEQKKEKESGNRHEGRVTAGKVYVTFVGPRGKQKLVITVSDATGNLVTEASVIIIDGEEVIHEKTNGDGVLVHQMDFTEHDRYVEVRTGNEHDQVWRTRMVGPTSTPRR